MKRWTGVKTVRKMFAMLLAFGACAAACAGTVRTATAPTLTLDTRIGLMKVVEDAATLRLSTRWDGTEAGTLTVNGTEATRLGAIEEADHVLSGLAPGEYVCRWTTGVSTNLATFCVRGGASALPPDGTGVRTATAVPVALDTRIGLVKVVEDAATLRLSTRWDGAPEGVLTVNGAEAARLGADEESDHVLSGLVPGEYVCQWTTGASTNLATFCVRGGASALPPDGAGVRTATAAPVALDTRIGLYKVLPVSDRGVASAVCRLSTRWDGSESGTLTVNGEEVRALGSSEEADHRLDGLAPGEYVCRWTAGDAAYLATFSVRGDGSARPPRTGVEVTITGHTATYAYDGREKRAGGFDVAISDPLYTAADFVFTGDSNAVRTAVGTTAFGMAASDFANVNPDFADVVFHVSDGSVTVTPGAVVNPFGPDDPSAPPAPGALARADCTAVYDGEGHSVSVAPLLGPALAADGAAVTYSPDPSRAPFAPESPVFTNAVSTSVWYRVASPNYAPFTTNALLEIRPRPVTLASKSAAKAYDGTPLTAHEVAVGGDGFVDGEGATYAFTGSQAAVGTSGNTFTYTLNGNTMAGNYEITAVNGTLTVTKANIGGGDDEPGDGDVPDGGLSKFDTTFVYDGEGHTVDTNALTEAFAVAMGGGETRVVYGHAAASAATTGQEQIADWREVAPVYTNAGEYVVWYRVTNPNYKDFVHVAKVTIAKRPVTLTSGTKLDFVYDGAAHTYPYIEVRGLGFVAGEGVVTSNWATVTTVAEGEVANTFDYAAQERTDLANYDITVVTGRITVVAAPIPVGPGGVVTAVGYTNVYDGVAHGVAVSVAGLLTMPTYAYAAMKDGEWSETSPVFTNVCDTQVWYCVSVPNYAPVVGTVGVKIEPRPITLTAPTKSKTYDGMPLTFGSDDVAVGGDGYVPGEAFALSGFASITDVGRVDAGYTVADGTARMDNYAITRVAGTLTVTRRAVMLTSKSGTKIYDGTPLTVHEVTVGGDGFADGEGATYAFTGEQTAVGTSENTFTYTLNENTSTGNYEISMAFGTLTVTKAVIGDGGDEPGDCEIPDGWFSKFDTAFVYDGEGHTVDTTALVEAFTVVMGGGETKVFYGYAATGAAATGQEQNAGLGTEAAATGQGRVADWREVVPVYTNVGEYVVWYRVTNPNYEDFVHQAKVTITKRPVTLTSGTKLDFVYDGQPHACPHFIKSGQDFVEGEGIEASNWATVTRVDEGEVANTFDYAPLDGTDFGNYALTVVTGRIAVVAASIPVGPGGAITVVGYTNVYDGATHGVAVSVVGLLTMPTVQYRVDEAEDWTDVSPTFSAVCDTQVWYRVSAPNYTPVVGAIGVRITPRPITLTSKSDTKVYDGMPLTAHGVAVGGDGFVDGEGASYAFTGSRTAVGTSENTFAYTLKVGTLAGNYEIATVNGTLTVTKAGVEVPAVASKPYNGEVQTADVPESGLYTVYANEGGRESGAYSLVLRLADAGNYRWLARDGVTVAGSFAFMTFTITKQDNAWTVEPSIGSWRTDEQAKPPVAAARYGTVTVSYRGTLANGDAYDSAFSPMNPGSYVACFTVRETEDYAGLYREVPFTVTERTVEPISVKAAGWLGIYDGRPHSIVLTVSGGSGTPAITYATAKDGVYAAENPAFTDVGVYTVWYRVVFPNFTPIEGSAVVSISRGSGGDGDGFVTVRPAGGNRTVRIRKTWFAGFEGFTDRFGSDLEKAAVKGTGKFDADGNEMQVWQDYVAGTDPMDASSRLTASIGMEDGRPVVHWTPALNGDRVRTGVRVYRVLGRNDLADGEWEPVADEADGRYRFFKVTVAMPETEE